MCVCWFVGLLVCLLFIGHTTFVHFAALPPSTPREAKPSRAAPRARRASACTVARQVTARQLTARQLTADMSQRDSPQRDNSQRDNSQRRQLTVSSTHSATTHSLYEMNHLSQLPSHLSASVRRSCIGLQAQKGTSSNHHSESTRACRTTSQRRNRCADAFQKQNHTRAYAVVYVTAEIFNKREKENQHATSQVQFTVCLLLDHGVFTFRIVLNHILHKSSLLAPMESRRTRRPTFTAEERLERRREQDRRRHAERRARERREQTQARRDVDRLRSSHLETQQLLDDLQRIQS